MPESHGFIDLRIGHGASGIGDDSVWPSFTDIMTVIVMIFLMALVVIMVRNFELDRQLISTISDKEAASLANQDLVQRLVQVEGTLEQTINQREQLKLNLDQELQRLSEIMTDQDLLQAKFTATVAEREKLSRDQELLEAKLTATVAEREKLSADQEVAVAEISKLTESELALNRIIDKLDKNFATLELKSSEKIAALTSDNLSLNEKLTRISSDLGEVKSILKQSETQNLELSEEVTSLQTVKATIEAEFDLANQELLTLAQLVEQRELENQALKSIASATEGKFNSLQDEFEFLDSEYRKLIRAARSTAGKQVVEVWFEKIGDQFRYRLKSPEQNQPVDMNIKQLNQSLLDLKQRFGRSLYTKILIPEGSQLSHSEAWSFTQDILQKYDYYYQ